MGLSTHRSRLTYHSGTNGVVVRLNWTTRILIVCQNEPAFLQPLYAGNTSLHSPDREGVMCVSVVLVALVFSAKYFCLDRHFHKSSLAGHIAHMYSIIWWLYKHEFDTTVD